MNAKQIGLAVVLMDFAAFTAYVTYQYGIAGIMQLTTANPVTILLFTDLLIALGLVSLWMLRDARERGVSALPYVGLTMLFGSVGPLLYLIQREGTPHRAALATARA
jgi:hypothetical protein